MLVHVKFPNAEFNAAVKDGTCGQKMRAILEEIKPETVYFTEYEGKRGAVMIVDLADPSKVPSIAEPFFLTFNAEVHFHVVMAPEELEAAGLDELGKKWG
jgi:hypothetical protein